MIEQLRTSANVAGIEALMQPNLQTKTVPAMLQSLALNEVILKAKILQTAYTPRNPLNESQKFPK